jgi:hypothetical protein
MARLLDLPFHSCRRALHMHRVGSARPHVRPPIGDFRGSRSLGLGSRRRARARRTIALPRPSDDDGARGALAHNSGHPRDRRTPACAIAQQRSCRSAWPRPTRRSRHRLCFTCGRRASLACEFAWMGPAHYRAPRLVTDDGKRRSLRAGSRPSVVLTRLGWPNMGRLWPDRFGL